MMMMMMVMMMMSPTSLEMDDVRKGIGGANAWRPAGSQQRPTADFPCTFHKKLPVKVNF